MIETQKNIPFPLFAPERSRAAAADRRQRSKNFKNTPAPRQFSHKESQRCGEIKKVTDLVNAVRNYRLCTYNRHRLLHPNPRR